MDDELEKIAPILNALRQVAQDPGTYRKSLEDVDAQFTQLLREASEAKAQASQGTRVERIRSALIGVIRHPKTKDALLEIIRLRCELTDRQVKLLRVSGLIKVDATGKPELRAAHEVVLAPARASIYLFVIGVLSGMALYPIFFAENANLELIVRSFGLGMALGSLGGYVLDQSFRAYPVVEKIKSLRPWFQGDIDRASAT